MKTEPKQALGIELNLYLHGPLHIENEAGVVTITPLAGGGMVIMGAPDAGFALKEGIIDGLLCMVIAKPETFERLEKEQQ